MLTFILPETRCFFHWKCISKYLQNIFSNIYPLSFFSRIHTEEDFLKGGIINGSSERGEIQIKTVSENLPTYMQS